MTDRAAAAGKPMTLSVVIPVYNELGTWRKLLDRVLAAPLPGWRKQVVLVDDGSTDGTRQQLRDFAASADFDGLADRADFKVIFHEANRGKGAALRTGFSAAAGDVVIIQDADLEYDPADYPRLVEPIAAGRADVVYGSRFAAPGSRKGYLKNYLANRFLTFLSNLTTRHRLTDMETCYKVFRRAIIQSIRLEQDRFGFEPEVTAKLSKLGVDICEVPISYDARTREEGKKIGWRDGLKAIWCILRYGLRRRSRVRRECAREN